MKRIIFLLSFLICYFIGYGQQNISNSKIVLGYYCFDCTLDYNIHEIKYEQLTHIAYAFVEPDTALGTIDKAEANMASITKLVGVAHQKDKKVIVSIGGQNTDRFFGPVVSDLNKRRKFVNSIKDLCVSTNCDGIDIDWEKPGAGEKDLFTTFIKELKSGLASTGRTLTLSIAIPGIDSPGFDLAMLSQCVDWFGVMTYDAQISNPLIILNNSPLPYCQVSMLWYSKFVPAEKLLMGIPFYGHKYDCKTSSCNVLADAIEAQFFLTIKKYLSRPNWFRGWDVLSSVPYLKNKASDSVITYNDQQSIQIKCNWIKENKFGGAIIWALGMDEIGSEQPLLCVVGKELLGIDCGSNAVTDIDGNVYKTVTIGTQLWMAENLNCKAIGSCCYNNDPANCEKYGRLYNWETAKNVCPIGWHLPSDAEWTTLINYLGGENIAKNLMKEIGTAHWQSPNKDANNSSGFTALPGGYLTTYNVFSNINRWGLWWSSTEVNSTTASNVFITFDNIGNLRSSNLKQGGFSVRCIKN